MLRDSVFEYRRNPELNSEGVFIHDFWTAERIEHGDTASIAGTRRYATLVDTLTFAPGERATYDATLRLNREEGAQRPD